jgi:2-amino-4-hydroxy-6-hydroxymethyldihydropteridine diphosphokinase
MTATILIGLGSNLRHGSFGAPPQVLRAAVQALNTKDLEVTACSRLITSTPWGPKQPRYTNAVIRADTILPPLALLERLKSLEQAFGRKPGRRWGPRVLDLDLLVYDQSRLSGRHLSLPHPGLALRPFVLWSAAELWPDWRHPCLGLTIRQLANRAGGRKTIAPAGFL